MSALPSYKEIIIDVVYQPKGPGIPKQHGGPVQAHKSYIVGEAGPELFVPNTSGEIIPNHKLANMDSQGGGGMGKMGSGGDTFIIHNHSAGAAALTMAMIKSNKTRRIQRSMGG